MIITLIFGLFLLFSIVAYILKQDDYCDWPSVLLVCSVVLFILVVVGLVINPATEISNIKKFESVGASLDVARSNQNIPEIELAAVQQKVIECNQWLAVAKYWAKNPFTNWFWPRAVLKMEPIR